MANPRLSFVNTIFDRTLTTHQTNPQLLTPEHADEIVAEFHAYYKARADASSQDRKLPYLATVQTSLSSLKKRLRLAGVDPAFLEHLHMNKEDSTILIHAKAQSVVDKSIDLPTVDADAIIVDCRAMMNHRDPYLRLIALAALTGRRTAELLFCGKFGPPSEKHATAERYWTCMRGFCKQRHDSLEPLIQRDVPLLESRDQILRVIQSVRNDLPVASIQEVNSVHAKPIQRRMAICMPASIKNIHNLRKFYVLACFQYFNDRSCNLPRFASEVLGHKTLSSTVIT